MIGFSNSIRSREVRPCTPELFWKTVRSKRVASVCATISDLREQCLRGELAKEEFEQQKRQLKQQLPIFTFHATFPAGRRCNEGAVPSGLSMIDIDHLPNPRGYYDEHVRPRLQELGIVLAHVTPSAEGLRLVFRIPHGMDLPAAQSWMAGKLHCTDYDASCKDLARPSFAVPEDYLLHIDEAALFASGNEERSSQEVKKSSSQEGGADGSQNIVAGSQKVVDGSQKAENNCQSPIANCQLSFKGLPYADITRELLRLTGGEPVPGERNTRLHRLAYHLRYICDDDEQLLLRIIPRYGLGEDEMRALIHSACTARRTSMPRLMNAAIKAAAGGNDDDAEGSASCDASCADTPPPMPDTLPPLVELLVSRTPAAYRPAVAHAIWPALGAHLCGVRFRYIDNEEHEATLMCVLAAETGAGKSCINAPIDRIMADIRARDEANRQREARWKEANKGKGANKAKEPRPEGLVIQWVSTDMTHAAFVLRLAESQGHFLYARMNEIEAFDALRGSSRNPQQFVIMRLAFDTGEYGQERVGEGSVSERVRVRFNWNASTTPARLQQYFARVLTDGPVSRINFCTLPQQEIGAEMPVYGTYDDDFDHQLRPYIERLCQASGLILCPQLDELAHKLRQELSDEAVLTQDRVYDNLARRALVIGWLKACVLYVAQGCQWDDAMEEFIRWSVNYDLWCKLRFFGKAIEQAELDENTMRRSGPRNLLESLPDTFTHADLLQLRLKRGMKERGTSDLLYQWQKRGFIRQSTVDSYEKLKYLTHNHGTDTDTHPAA